MKHLPILIAALAAPAAATAATPPRNVHDHAEVERYIRECESEWASSAAGDAAVQKAFLAEDYEGVSISGKVLTKAQMLAADAGEASDVLSDRMDYVRVRFPAANVALAQGTETEVRKDGSRRTAIWTDTWLLRGGRWQIVASQDALLARPSPAKE